MTYTNFELVREFHKQFGHQLPSETVDATIFDSDPSLIKLRLNLIDEEVNELLDAVKQNNLIEAIDALADILYVTYGACVALGFDMDSYMKMCLQKLFQSFKSQDFDKSDTNFESVRKLLNRSDKNLPKFTLTNALLNTDTETINICDHFVSYLKQLKQHIGNKDLNNFFAILGQIIRLSYLAGINFGYNMDAAFLIVHQNNMSKLCSNENEAIESVKHYKTLPNFKNQPISYRLSCCGKYYIVYNTDSTKILKSMNWREPDFKPLFNN